MTQINLSEFKKVLSICKSFKESKSYAPILTHFSLNKDKVLAFNDRQGIEYHFETGLEVALPGQTTLDILSTLNSNTISFKQKDHILEIIADKTKAKLPILTKDSFIFEIPNLSNCISFNLTKEFLDGLRSCMISTSKDIMYPHRDAVRVVINKNKLKMFSTNGETVARYETNFNNTDNIFIDVLIPSDFCDQLQTLVDLESTNNTVYISKDFIVCSLKDICRIYSSLIKLDEALDFESVFDSFLSPNMKWIPIPKDISNIIERACFLTPEINKFITSISGDSSNILKIKSESDIGVSEDKLELEDTIDEGTLVVDPKMVKKIIPFTSKMCFLFDKKVLGISNLFGSFICFLSTKVA